MSKVKQVAEEILQAAADVAVQAFIPPVVRQAFGFDVKAHSDAHATFHEGQESMTDQSDKDSADINVMVKQFGLTGSMPQGVHVPMQGDFYDAPDFRGCLELMREADDAFMQYPAHIRAQFDNDPVRFVEFVSDPKNVEQCRLWGLANAAPVADNAPVPPVEEVKAK